MVLGEASEARLHGGTVRCRWRWSSARGEGDEARHANVLYNGGDRLHIAQGEANFGNPNTPPGLVSGAGCCHFTLRTG